VISSDQSNSFIPTRADGDRSSQPSAVEERSAPSPVQPALEEAILGPIDFAERRGAREVPRDRRARCRAANEATARSSGVKGRVPLAPFPIFAHCLGGHCIAICRRREKTMARRRVTEFIGNDAITFVQSRSLNGHSWVGDDISRPGILVAPFRIGGSTTGLSVTSLLPNQPVIAQSCAHFWSFGESNWTWPCCVAAECPRARR
jgi:hypothetical protein